MNFNKCSRCGNFYVSEGNVCPKCSPKDNRELSTFKEYIDANGLNNSLDTISGETGISVKNLNRFLNYEGFEQYKQNIDLNSTIGNQGIIFN